MFAIYVATTANVYSEKIVATTNGNRHLNKSNLKTTSTNNFCWLMCLFTRLHSNQGSTS